MLWFCKVESVQATAHEEQQRKVPLPIVEKLHETTSKLYSIILEALGPEQVDFF